ncbi:MAG: hypothetical protein ACR2K3_01795 [Nocardioides sp.]
MADADVAEAVDDERTAGVEVELDLGRRGRASVSLPVGAAHPMVEAAVTMGG